MTIAAPARVPRRLLWAVVAASLITMISLGVRATIGLFLTPISDALDSPRAVFALAVAIQNLVWGLGQPVAGALADRFGSGRVLVIGSGIYAGGMVLMANSTTAVGLYVSGGFIVGLGLAAASFSVVLAAVGRIAPPERRSMALGIVTAMGSVGHFVLVPVAQAWISDLGWQTAMVILGVIALSIVLAVRPVRGSAAEVSGEAEADRVPLRQDLARAARSKHYVLLNAAFFVCGFHVTFIATHLPAYAGDVGVATAAAATALSLVGLFNIGGSLAAGALGQRYSKTRLLSIIYGARAVVITAFVLTPISATTIVVFGALMGVLWLSTVPLTSGIVVQQFGTTHSGTLFGIVFMSHQVGAFIGAWMGGAVVDATASYLPAWWTAVGLGVFAAIVHLFIDDGPVAPYAPVVGRRWRVAPTTGALLLVLAMAVGPFLDTRRPAVASDAPYLCVLHPTDVRLLAR